MPVDDADRPLCMEYTHNMTGVRSRKGLSGSVDARMGSSRTITTNGVVSEVRIRKYRTKNVLRVLAHRRNRSRMTGAFKRLLGWSGSGR